MKLVEDLDIGPKAPRSDNVVQPRIRGSRPVELHISYERDLTEADIAALSQPRGVRPKSLVRIHASHHSLARCLATGMRPQQAALVTGYSPGRISQLQNDPSFNDLVAEYRSEAKSIFADLAERMNDLSLDAIEHLQERLHESPETFTVDMLLDMVKAFADRTGHGPNQEVTLKVDRDFIDRPPRETFDEWQERRTREIEGPPDSLGSTTRTTN